MASMGTEPEFAPALPGSNVASLEGAGGDFEPRHGLLRRRASPVEVVEAEHQPHPAEGRVWEGDVDAGFGEPTDNLAQRRGRFATSR